MICRNVEFGEVVVIILDFRSLNDLIAHADEDALDFLESDRVRMAVADELHFCRQSYVDLLRCELAFHLLCIEFLLCLLHLLLDGKARVIDPLAYLRTVFRGDSLHRL